jgi:hypothetical protein
MDVDVVETNVAENNKAGINNRGFRQLSFEERKKLSAEGRCFKCKKQGHMSRDCPERQKDKGKTSIPQKRKLRTTDTANESEEDSGSESDEADDARSHYSKATSRTMVSQLNRLTTEEKKELFDQLLNQGF